MDTRGLYTSREFVRRLLLFYYGFSALAVVEGVLLISFSMDFTLRQLQFGFLAIVFSAPPVFALEFWLICRHARPVTQVLRLMEGDQVPTDAQRAAAVVRALNLPFLALFRVMAVHGPLFFVGSVGLGLGVFNALFDTGYTLWHAVGTFGGMLFVIATVHAILEYFAALRLVRALIPQLHTPELVLSDTQRDEIVPVGLRQRLLFLSVFITFVPLAVLGVSVAVRGTHLLDDLGIDHPLREFAPLLAGITVLIVFITGVTVSIAVLLARDTAQLAERMSAAMQQVAAGNLDIRLAITTTDEFAALYDGFNRMTRGLQERERLRDAFGRYVAPEIAEQVIREGVRLGGDMVTASVLFADIRGFTALSEQLSASEIVALLNRYFAAVEPAIKAEGGWINKFGGDSLLAVFGAPVPRPDHVRCAVRAALGMRAALHTFNTTQRASGAAELRIGVGITCGEMISGSVGSPDRMEYTVIGDAVNVAARIEALNKEWGTDILISEAVYRVVCHDTPTQPMPAAEVRGKTEPLQVFAVL